MEILGVDLRVRWRDRPINLRKLWYLRKFWFDFIHFFISLSYVTSLIVLNGLISQLIINYCYFIFKFSTSIFAYIDHVWITCCISILTRRSFVCVIAPRGTLIVLMWLVVAYVILTLHSATYDEVNKKEKERRCTMSVADYTMRRSLY